MPLPNEIIKSLSPKAHEILNLRLADGTSALSILYWMNNDPEIREVLDERFFKIHLTEKDLADWDILRKTPRPVPIAPKPAIIPTKGSDDFKKLPNTQTPPGPNFGVNLKPLLPAQPAPPLPNAESTSLASSPKPPSPESPAVDPQRSTPPSPGSRNANSGHDPRPIPTDCRSKNSQAIPPLPAVATASPTQPARSLPNPPSATRPPTQHSLVAFARALSKDAAEIAATGLTAEDLLLVVTARYAELLQNWEDAHGSTWSQRAEIHFNRRLIALQDLTKAALALRKCEQQDARIKLDRERLKLLREKQSSKSTTAARPSASPSSSEPSPTPQTAPDSSSTPAAANRTDSLNPSSTSTPTSGASIHASTVQPPMNPQTLPSIV